LPSALVSTESPFMAEYHVARGDARGDGGTGDREGVQGGQTIAFQRSLCPCPISFWVGSQHGGGDQAVGSIRDTEWVPPAPSPRGHEAADRGVGRRGARGADRPRRRRLGRPPPGARAPPPPPPPRQRGSHTAPQVVSLSQLCTWAEPSPPTSVWLAPSQRCHPPPLLVLRGARRGHGRPWSMPRPAPGASRLPSPPHHPSGDADLRSFSPPCP